MDKKEAYRICHVYPDKEIPFTHEVRGVLFEGKFIRLSKKDCKTYYPFTVQTTGTAKLVTTGKITCHDIGRRYKTMEDAVVHVFNMCNDNANIKNKYASLEDILFE